MALDLQSECLHLIGLKEFTFSIISHEAVHVVNSIYERIGIHLDIKNDEPQAYLTGWVVSEVVKFLFNNMGKYKFVLTKHTKQNGDYYYTCKVVIEAVEVRKPKNIFELLKHGASGVSISVVNEYYIDDSGYAYDDYDRLIGQHDSREKALSAIDMYIEREEEKNGEKVVSTETEIIYK